MASLGALLAVLLCIAFAPSIALSQVSHQQSGAETNTGSDIILPDPLTQEAVNELISRLSDKEVRELLLSRLDTVAQPPPAAKGTTVDDLVAFFSVATEQTTTAITSSIAGLSGFLTAQGNVLNRVFVSLGGTGLGYLVLSVLMAVILAVAAEWAVHWLVFRRPGSRPVSARPENFLQALRQAGRQLRQELVGALVFALVFFCIYRIIKPEDAMPLLQTTLFWVVLMPRFSIALVRFFFKPAAGEARLLSLDGRSSNILFWNFVGITYLVGFGFSISAMNNALGGPPDAQPDAFWFWFNLAFFGWLAIIFGTMPGAWRSIMLGDLTELTPFEAWKLRAYPWFAVAAIAATWLLSVSVTAMNAGELLAGGRHVISLAILLIAPLLDTLIHAIVRQVNPPMRGESASARKAYEASYSAYIRIGRVLIFGAVLLVTARLWNITPKSMAMATADVGEKFAGTLVQVGLILVCGYLVWEVARLLMNIRLAREETPEPRGGGAPMGDVEGHMVTPTSRLGTILPPISKALQVLIATLTVLTALAHLGVDVTALLAGAGIVGIAVGFGAQKLVGDVISGMFFLIDDAFRLFEYIDVGGSVGTVERISLRSIRLRDSKGPVLVIPYSEIKKVTNFGRDWGIMKLRFTVPFDTDIEQVRKIFKRIGQEMLEDPELAPGFIEPFKSQGVYEFNDYGIVVRGKFTHKPGAQFAIRKRVFTRVKEEFHKAGIQFARREVKVDLGDHPEQLSEEQASKIAAAAAGSLREPERAAEGPKAPRDDR